MSERSVFNGWSYYWRGWVGVRGLGKFSPQIDNCCHFCSVPIDEGSDVSFSVSRDVAHWACAYPEINPPVDIMVGAWYATNEQSPAVFVVSAYPGLTQELPRGSTFNVEQHDAQVLIASGTDEDTKTLAQEDARIRLIELLEAKVA